MILLHSLGDIIRIIVFCELPLSLFACQQNGGPGMSGPPPALCCCCCSSEVSSRSRIYFCCQGVKANVASPCSDGSRCHLHLQLDVQLLEPLRQPGQDRAAEAQQLLWVRRSGQRGALLQFSHRGGEIHGLSLHASGAGFSGAADD